MRIHLDTDLEELTGAIIGAAFEVSNILGHGFLEIVYRKALLHELTLRGFQAEEEVPFEVGYKGKSLGQYYADILVVKTVIVELKAIEKLTLVHVGQVLNYLKASGLRVGLLFNFGVPKLEFRRVLL
jgi:GxxExxY protein